ncbi:MAG: N-acetyl-gamma-glutamyl-phosphate reductase [Flavobacteriales bacterium AspAUS03]
MIEIGIMGGAGYTAGELIRLLIHHPKVVLRNVLSTTQAGKPFYVVHQDLLGETDMRFTDTLDQGLNVVFLCLGHGMAQKALENIPQSTKVIDLSQDFRLAAQSTFGGRTFIYGLPEQQRDRIKMAEAIANPGCFATAIQLAFLPLAHAQALNSDIHVSAITGATGAGRGLNESIHFSWRDNNASTYKVFTHQHLYEIRESLDHCQKPFQQEIYFVPYRGNFSRGIIATVYTDSNLSLKENKTLYLDYYGSHPFVQLSDEVVHLKQVIGTNKCVLHLAEQKGKLIITSVIDNLLKGASGQAVQNLNLMYAWEESCGLRLKPIGF